jgi:hypothetical protein
VETFYIKKRTMKNFLKLSTLPLAALCISLTALSVPTSATAEPLSEQDYLAFDTSVRDRAKGQKRFTQVLQLVYGSQDLFEDSFGGRGPAPQLRLSLKGRKGSITFRGAANENVTVEEFNFAARPGRDMLVLLVNNARCQIGKKQPETCQAEIRVIKGRNSISNRIVANGSNGVEYDSGSLDVKSGGLVIDGNNSN